jgi:hypothetical protein
MAECLARPACWRLSSAQVLAAWLGALSRPACDLAMGAISPACLRPELAQPKAARIKREVGVVRVALTRYRLTPEPSPPPGLGVAAADVYCRRRRALLLLLHRCSTASTSTSFAPRSAPVQWPLPAAGHRQPIQWSEQSPSAAGLQVRWCTTAT